MSTEAMVTITLEEYDRLKSATAASYERGFDAGLNTARREFAEVNAHKNELLRSVEALKGLLADARAKQAA